MKKWNLIIDVAKCHDCNNCFLACKDEHYENSFLPYTESQPRHGHRWMNIHRKERGQYPMVDVAYLPVPCMHCDDAPCMKNTNSGSVYQRDDGILLIDPEKSIGKKEIVTSCPYNAIWWNDEKNIPQKCTLCAHLLDGGWKEPRCVQSCPTGALQIIQEEDSEIKNIIKSENLETFRPEYSTQPRVYYKNINRFLKCFIGGNVALKDTDECAEGAKVSLTSSKNEIVGTSETNNYGDFKIDNIDPKSGEYTLEISFDGYENKILSFELSTSINLGHIFLEKT